MKFLDVSTKKYPDKYVLLDNEDYDFVIKLGKWSVDKKGKHSFYAIKIIGGKKMYLHRLIMSSPKGKIVDHINGNTLDCRQQNLRICGFSGNAKNKSVSKTKKSSIYKGVYLTKSGGYVARIWCSIKKTNIYLGRFEKEKDAACRYNLACHELHGEFARLNII